MQTEISTYKAVEPASTVYYSVDTRQHSSCIIINPPRDAQIQHLHIDHPDQVVVSAHDPLHDIMHAEMSLRGQAI